MNIIITKITHSNKKLPTQIKKSSNIYNQCMVSISSAITSESDFKSASKSDSKSDYESDYETDSNLVFLNLDICIFFVLYLHSSK